MNHTISAVCLTIGFSLVGVLGDYFLKVSSSLPNPFATVWFYLGFALYASTAFGWVYVMQHLKLATISVVYSVSVVLFLSVLGWVVFRESLTTSELVGVGLGIVALVLLVRAA